MKLKANEYIYSIKNLTYGEVRQIEYAYGQFIHNAVSGDFAETNGRLDELRDRIEKKPITETSSDEEFITIPKPKYKVGDKFKDGRNIYEVENVFFDFDLKMWVYVYDYKMYIEIISENELELVEEGR